MKNDTKNSWFKIKRYPHIGLPPPPSEYGKLISYIKNVNNIKKHGFYPFIHKQIVTRKFRRTIFKDGKRSKDRSCSHKIRNIYIPNNIDSNIYSYYSSILESAYERKLRENGLSEVVTAYRSIPLRNDDPNVRNKCNIDFAEDVFSFIRSKDDRKLTAIAVDITSFFDNLDHKLVKKKWIEVMEFNSSLPGDHYNVFKNITKFAYVHQWEVFKEFKDQIIIQRNDGEILKRKIDRVSYLKGKNAIAFCEAKDIKLLREKNYIKSNKTDKKGNIRAKGIPQGSPISSVLANIYLLDFDKKLNNVISKLGGIYRRYSDDIVVVAPHKYEKQLIELLQKEISKYKLNIKKEKTQVFWFLRVAERYYCFERNTECNLFQKNTKFEYLGFAFDGKYTTLKSASLANYYRKMKKSIKRGSAFAALTSVKERQGKLFKRRLYKRFTYLGASRRRKYKRSSSKSNRWEISTHYDWGNYLSYALMAARVMEHNKIYSQIKNHWKKFHDLIS